MNSESPAPDDAPCIDFSGADFARPGGLGPLEAALPGTIAHRRWFGAKARSITTLRVTDAIAVPAVNDTHLLLVDIEYSEGAPDTYLLPVRIVDAVTDPTAVLMHIRGVGSGMRTLIDACHDASAAAALLAIIEGAETIRGTHGSVSGIRTEAFAAARGTADLEATVWRREGSNTSIVYGDALMLKLFRRPEPGTNPDWELGRFLTDRAHFHHVPATAGALEYTGDDGSVRTFGLLQQLVPNDGDARQYFMRGLRHYFAEIAISSHAPTDFAELRHEASLAREATPDLARRWFTEALDAAHLLGQRTAEMHLALASASEPGLAPEPFTTAYQRELHAAAHDQLEQTLLLLQRRLNLLDGPAEVEAERLLGLSSELRARLDAVRDLRIDARRIRVHGDYHLEQVLIAADDFIILDFEGEPSAPLADRRIPRSPLKDVAGMLRSFDYAARPVLAEFPHSESGRLSAACTYWVMWVGGAFLDGYLATGGEVLLPEGREASEALLRDFLLEKASYEVVYELNNRPAWVDIPLRGMLEQLR